MLPTAELSQDRSDAMKAPHQIFRPHETIKLSLPA